MWVQKRSAKLWPEQAKQGQQWHGWSGLEKAYEASALQKELQATKEFWDGGKSSSGKSTPADYLIPNGQTWKQS